MLTFDEKTEKLLEGTNSNVRDFIAKSIENLYKARKLKEDAAKMEDEAKEYLVPLLISLGTTEKLTAPGYGSIQLVKVDRGSRFDRKKFEQYLLQKGVAATLLKEVKAAATTDPDIRSEVRFRLLSS